MKITFNHVDEFLNELSLRPPDLEPVVRVTRTYQQSQYPYQHLRVQAGYLRHLTDVPVLVELVTPILGQIWGREFADQDRPVHERADTIAAQLAEAIQHAGLTLAAGRYNEER